MYRSCLLGGYLKKEIHTLYWSLLILTHCSWSLRTLLSIFCYHSSYSRAVQTVVLSEASDIIVHFLLQEFGCIVRDHVSVDLVQVLCPSLCFPCLCNVLLFAIFVVAYLLGFAHDLPRQTVAFKLISNYFLKIQAKLNN